MIDTLAVTWSPDPKKFNGVRPIFQYYETLPFIQMLKHSCDFTAYPEISPTGHFHWHFKIHHFHDRVKWFKVHLPKLKFNGFVLIKYKNIDNGWDDYMSKDKELMQDILQVTLPVISTYNRYKDPVLFQHKTANRDLDHEIS